MSSVRIAAKESVCTTIRPKGGSETPFCEIPGGARLTRGSYVLGYQGALHGEGVLEELRCYQNHDTAVVLGFERVTGTLGELSGSFMLEHVGKLEHGVLISRRSVVPGSGTGDFARLRGVIEYADSGGLEHPILFEYSLD